MSAATVQALMAEWNDCYGQMCKPHLEDDVQVIVDGYRRTVGRMRNLEERMAALKTQSNRRRSE